MHLPRPSRLAGISLSLLPLLLVCPLLWAQKPLRIEFEQARFEAMTRRDTQALRAMLHEDLLYVHSNGLTESKSSHLAAIASGKIVYASMESEPIRRQRWHRTTVVNGILQVKGTLQSKDFALDLRYTAVYRKKRGRWLLWSWQSTKL
jgi:ketosteroid isomerase-like protein